LIGRIVLLAVVALAVVGCTPEGMGGITLVTHGSHRVTADERIPGSVAVAGGTLVVEPGAGIDGDVYVGDGELVVAGSIGGDVSAIGGLVRLQPSSHVHGTVHVGASAIVARAPTARVDGGVDEGFMLPDRMDAASSPAADIAWAAARALAAVLVALLIRRIAPGRVARTRACLVGMPAESLSYGFLVAIVGLSLIVFMAFTIVLIPVALVAIAALALAVLVGLAAVLDELQARVRPGLPGRLSALGAVLLAAVGLAVLPSVPLLGLPLSALIVLAVLGAAALAFQRPTSGEARPK